MSAGARRNLGFALLAVTALVALVPGALPPENVPIWLHHILHGMLMVGGCATGLIACADTDRTTKGERPLWLVPAILAPVFAMISMSPNLYRFLDQHPLIHATEHFAYVLLGFVAAYSGERYARGVGWISGILLALMAFGAALGFGVGQGADG